MLISAVVIDLQGNKATSKNAIQVKKKHKTRVKS